MGLLNRILGREEIEKNTLKEMSPEAAEKIVREYGAVLGGPSAPSPVCVADVGNLPYSKERIKQAFVIALRLAKETQMRESLKIGYIALADWQEGVGNETLGIDLTNIDLDGDPLEMANRIASQRDAMKKWTPIVQAESEELKSELQKLGLW